MIKLIKLNNKATFSYEFVANRNFTLCDMLLVRYASNSSQDRNPKDWEVGSETGKADIEAADSWEKVQSSTTAYFKAMKDLAGDVTRPGVLQDVEKLISENNKLVSAAEHVDPYSDVESDRGIIKKEGETIKEQSKLIDKSEDILNSVELKEYSHYRVSVRGSSVKREGLDEYRKSREEALTERWKYENLWNEELDYNEEKQLEENSKGKRKLEVDLEEQGESSKKRRDNTSPNSEENNPMSIENLLEEPSKGKQPNNPMSIENLLQDNTNPQQQVESSNQPESSNQQSSNQPESSNQPQSSNLQRNESSANISPLDHVLGLPQEHNPFDDVGGGD